MLEENVFVGTNCQSFDPSKVQCDKEGNMPIHILDKYCEETDTRYNIYPLTVIQAIFDGVTGTRLDRILAACNSIYLTWEGTFADTVNKLDKIYRRKGYIITYRDETNVNWTQRYNSDDISDEAWTNPDNWEGWSFDTVIKDLSKVLEEIFTNIGDYKDFLDVITSFINEFVINVFNNLNNYPELVNIIKNSTVESLPIIIKDIFNNINEYPELKEIFNQYIKQWTESIFNNISSYPALNQFITNAINSHVETTIGNIFNNIDRFPILKNLIETKVESRVTYIFENINSFTELLNVIKGNIEDIFDNIDDHTNLKLVIENKVESTVEKILTNIDDYPIIKEKITQFCNEVIEAKRGVANGIASLDGDGKVPASQLPSYVDDVLEGYFIDDTHFAEKYVEDAPVYYTPEKGKIYVDISEDTEYSGKTYRWSGTKYVVISETLALGEVTGTAYDGGKGKKTTDIVNSLSNELVSRLDRVEQTAEGLKIIYSKSIKNNDTNLYNTPSPVGLVLNNASKTANGSMSAADKVKLDETLPNQITELSNNVYTKEEINNKFDNVPTVENTYTKAEVDKAIADAIKALIPAGYELVIKKKTT